MFISIRCYLLLFLFLSFFLSLSCLYVRVSLSSSLGFFFHICRCSTYWNNNNLTCLLNIYIHVCQEIHEKTNCKPNVKEKWDCMPHTFNFYFILSALNFVRLDKANTVVHRRQRKTVWKIHVAFKCVCLCMNVCVCVCKMLNQQQILVCAAGIVVLFHATVHLQQLRDLCIHIFISFRSIECMRFLCVCRCCIAKHVHISYY